MKPLAYRPEVERELNNAVRRYEDERKGLGQRFYRRYHEGLRKIRQNPLTGFPSEEGTRTLTVPGFPYGIVFTEFDDHVQIVAVSHFKRRPGYWVSRLEDES